ncbi:MAG: hypothetical protein MUE54_09105, partial [Anaerolineae bacterium]|nr:hypothetical protein [Anaerolineae bacterium]
AEPTARLVLDTQSANFDATSQYEVRLNIMSYLEEDVMNSLTLSINGATIPLIRNANSFIGEIGGEVIFQTDRVSNPFDLGIQDGRKLGVALSELTIAPVNDDE